MPFDKKRFGETIRELRTKKGWSQGTLSDRSDVSIPMISFFENGRRTPYADTVVKLADAFGISAAELLDQFLEAHAESDENDSDQRFIRAFQAAGKDQKRNVKITAGIVLSGDPEAFVP